MDEARDAASREHHVDMGADSSDGAGFSPPRNSGARLRAAREALGLSIADISARTRITQRHVEAMDRGDLAALPGRPYILGFIRNYARAVGLDQAEIAAMARREMEASVPKPQPRMVHQFDVDDPAKTPSRLLTWLAAGLFVLIVLAGFVFWRSYYMPAADLPALSDPQVAPIQAQPAPQAIPQAPSASPSDMSLQGQPAPVPTLAAPAMLSPSVAPSAAPTADHPHRRARAPEHDAFDPAPSDTPTPAPSASVAPAATPAAAQ